MERSRADQILDIAECGIRRGGIGAVSFRDIADAVGIKSASVHYHFPQKCDLGRAVVARYADRIFDALGDPEDGPTPRDRIARLTAGYRRGFEGEGTSCLCLVLGSSMGDLPPPVAAEVARFFERMLDWTARALDPADPAGARDRASSIVAGLMGAMVLAVTLRAPHHLAIEETAILARL